MIRWAAWQLLALLGRWCERMELGYLPDDEGDQDA